MKPALKCSGAIWLALNAATIFASTGSVDRIDRFIETELNRSNVPGASLAIVRNGLLEKAKGYSLADVERNVAATEGTVFQWASLTKQFTAEAIMLLVQEGKLRLSDRIATYYRSAPPAWSNITIRHLLTHTSGIKNYTALPDFSKTLRKNITLTSS